MSRAVVADWPAWIMSRLNEDWATTRTPIAMITTAPAVTSRDVSAILGAIPRRGLTAPSQPPPYIPPRERLRCSEGARRDRRAYREAVPRGHRWCARARRPAPGRR